MTINGFWGQFSDLERVSFAKWISDFYHREKRFPQVGIDAFQWVFEATGATDLPFREPDIDIVISRVIKRIRDFMKYNVNFVLVFDGSIKRNKLRRQVESVNSYDFDSIYAEELLLLKTGAHLQSLPLISKLKGYLDSWNISYVTASGDGEIELGRLNESGIIDAVITNDADALAYGATCILRNFSKSVVDKPISSSEYKYDTPFYVTPFTINYLNSIGLDKASIMLIACITGDDYTPGWSTFGTKAAFALANKKWKFAERFSKIYVSSLNEYIQGKPAHSQSQRLFMMNRLIDDINDTLEEYSKEILGKFYKKRIERCSVKPRSGSSVPNDYDNLAHFFPLATHYLFRFEENRTNTFHEVSNSWQVPYMPQQITFDIKTGNSVFIRGSDSGLTGYTLVENFKVGKDYTISKNFDLWNDVDWGFHTQCIPANVKHMNRHLYLELTKAYLLRLIQFMDKLKLPGNAIKIEKLSTKGSKEAKLAESLDMDYYKVSFDAICCMGDIIKFDVKDENGLVSPIKGFLWIPKYLIESSQNGQKLINEFLKVQNEKLLKKSPKKRTPRGSPKKTQSSDLFNLQKSPIRVIKRCDVDVIDKSIESPVSRKLFPVSHNESNGILSTPALSSTFAERISKRNKETPATGTTHKKKLRKFHSITEGLPKFDPPSSPNGLYQRIEIDPEVSQVLGNDEYVGSPETEDIDNQFTEVCKLNSHVRAQMNSTDFLHKKAHFSKALHLELVEKPEHTDPIVISDDSFSDGSLIPPDFTSNLSKSVFAPNLDILESSGTVQLFSNNDKSISANLKGEKQSLADTSVNSTDFRCTWKQQYHDGVLLYTDTEDDIDVDNNEENSWPGRENGMHAREIPIVSLDTSSPNTTAYINNEPLHDADIADSSSDVFFRS